MFCGFGLFVVLRVCGFIVAVAFVGRVYVWFSGNW